MSDRLLVPTTLAQIRDRYRPGHTIRSVSNEATLRTIGTTLVPLISVRLNAANQDKVLRFLLASLFCDNNSSAILQLVKGATLTAPTWNTPTGSYAEFDVVATALTGGTILGHSFLKSSAGAPSLAQISAVEAAVNLATTDVLTLAVRTFSGSGNFSGAIGFKELLNVSE